MTELNLTDFIKNLHDLLFAQNPRVSQKSQGFITSEKELQFFSQVLYIPESLAKEVDSYTSHCQKKKKKSSDH